MNFIPDLSKADLEYICSEIPSVMVTDYFTRHPKDFQKLRPGFRAKSLKPEELSRILLDNCDTPFISHFINDTIQHFLNQIEDCFQSLINSGESVAQAYLQTLSKSYFRHNVPLYVRIAGRNDLTEEAVEYIEAALKLEEKLQQRVKTPLPEKADRRRAELEKKLQTREKELSKLSVRITKSEQENERLTREIKKGKAELVDKSKQLVQLEEALSCAKSSAEKHKGQIAKLEQQKIRLEEQLNVERLHTQELEAEVDVWRSEELQRQAQKQVPHMVYAPNDIDEFYECFEYNLTDIGIDDSESYKDLLVHYLGRILFLGMPVLANRGVSYSIAQCVSNALMGTKVFDILIYKAGITADKIQEFLSKAGRVVCLDGFIGNFNELALIPIVGAHRDKIIFLTTVSERTAMCLATDFLLHCIYFNANRTGKLLRPCDTSEEGTTIEEHPVESINYQVDQRAQRIFGEIAKELQIPASLAECWKVGISSDEELCQVLAFTVLPYCADALYLKPYSVSPRLQKYAGETSRCPYKDLLIRWFGR